MKACKSIQWSKRAQVGLLLSAILISGSACSKLVKVMVVNYTNHKIALGLNQTDATIEPQSSCSFQLFYTESMILSYRTKGVLKSAVLTKSEYEQQMKANGCCLIEIH